MKALAQGYKKSLQTEKRSNISKFKKEKLKVLQLLKWLEFFY